MLLLLGAELEDARAHERGLDRDHRADRGVAAPDLLDDEAVAEVVEAGAAVLVGDDRAEVALRGDLLDQVQVEVVVAGVFARALDDLLVGELPRGVADQALLVGQIEVHVAPSRRLAGSSGSPRLVGCCGGGWYWACACTTSIISRTHPLSQRALGVHGACTRRCSSCASPSIGRRSWVSESRSRTVTVPLLRRCRGRSSRRRASRSRPGGGSACRSRRRRRTRPAPDRAPRDTPPAPARAGRPS